MLDKLKQQIKDTANECEFYKQVCEKQGYDLEQDVTESNLGEVPYISWSAFKESNECFHKLIRVPLEDLAYWTISSSTTGDPSLVGRGPSDIEVFKNNYGKVFEDFCKMSTLTHLVLFSPSLSFLEKMPGEWLGKRGFLFYKDISSLWDGFDISYLLEFKLYKTIFYMITHFKKKAFIEINKKLMETSLKRIERNKYPSLVANSPPLMYTHFMEYKKKHGQGFDMPPTFRVQTGGGGWSGVKGRVDIGKEINKAAFHEELMDFFNIPIENFADLFGATETPVACGGHWSKKHDDIILHMDPSQGTLLLRDPETLEPITKKNTPGLLEFITPYGVDTYAGLAVLLDDVAEILDFKKCSECGREGIVFKIVKKFTPETGKGCTSFTNFPVSRLPEK